MASLDVTPVAGNLDPYSRHQILGRDLLEKFPELDPALGWRIVDWVILSVLKMRAVR